MSDEIKACSISEAIGTVIAKLCYRACDDLGESFSETTGNWRRENAIAILQKADAMYSEQYDNGEEQAHPRLVHHIIEEGSWSDSLFVRDMWAGLLTSSCTKSGDDESNLMFINLLKQLSNTQVIILNYACEISNKAVSTAGWIGAELLPIELDKLIEITNVDDVHRLDRELDHLRALELIHTGFHPNTTTADITPTSLALQLYVRSQGYIGSPVDYFGIDSSEQP